MANEFNPIAGVGTTSSNIAPIMFDTNKYARAPSSYQYLLQDVSSADSGRVEDTTMYKNQVGQLVAVELGWTNLSTAEASAILNAFNHEYVWVSYLDLQQGRVCKCEFYVGDRSAPMYNCRLDVWSNLTFKIIQRNGQTAPTPVTS